MQVFALIYVYFFAFSLILTLILIPIVRRVALKFEVVAFPKESRLHKIPTPLLGGVAIFIAFYITILLNYFLAKWNVDTISKWSDSLLPYLDGAVISFNRLAAILFCGLLIFGLGLIDDLRTLGPKRKFFFQVLMGIILFYSDIRITAFAPFEWVSLFFTVLWVVSITNAFNLLDNIDGLAAGVAGIASLMLFLLCVNGHQVLIAILLVTFLGTLMGFLRYNFPPAKIFMGDCGSLLIGFFLSALSMMSTYYVNEGLSLVPLVAPVMILSVPIYDTLSVIFIRLRNKKSIFVGDKNHFSHRLLKVGMSNRQAVIFIYLVGLCTGIAALTLIEANITNQIILLIQSVLLIMLIHLLKNFRMNNPDQKDDI